MIQPTAYSDLRPNWAVPFNTSNPQRRKVQSLSKSRYKKDKSLLLWLTFENNWLYYPKGSLLGLYVAFSVSHRQIGSSHSPLPLATEIGFSWLHQFQAGYYLRELWASFLSESQVAGPPEAATPLCSPVTAFVSSENGRSKKSILPVKEVLFQILIPLPCKCPLVRRASLTIFLFSALWSRVALCSSLGIIPHSCPHANASAVLWAG